MSEQPLLDISEDLAPSEPHARAWSGCMGKDWFFGHGAHDGDAGRLQQVKERREAMASAPLRVIRQYANGPTCGRGGKPGTGDDRPGSFTLVCYPMRKRPSEWDGKTVLLGPDADIGPSVRPRPNKGVLFGSRIPNA